MGIGFLSDGRMALAVTDYVGGGAVPSPRAGSRILIVSGMTGDMQDIRIKEVANFFRQPSGLLVVDDRIYVSDRDAFYQILDNDFKGDLKLNRKLVVKWPDENNWKYGFAWHHWVFTPMHWKGRFYAPNSGSIVPGGPSDVGPATAMDGAFLQWDSTGRLENFAGGLRSPNGAGINPDGEMFVADNQGSWLPSSTFMHMKPGRFYGHRNSPANWAETLPYQPPAAWLPEPEVRNSPTQPVCIPAGPFAGDWLIGDDNNYGLIRVALDEVKGEYQGAVFWFSQGFSDIKFCSGTAGSPAINRLAYGPDGGLYIGTFEKVVGTPSWSKCGPAPFYKLTPKPGASSFEMRAIRSMKDGFEIEFTEPVNPARVLPANFSIKQEKYTRNPEYGVGRGGYKTLTVTGTELSSDRKRVHVKVGGLSTVDVVTYFVVNNFISSEGVSLYSNEAWYTLNAIGDATWDPVSAPERKRIQSSLASHIEWRAPSPGTLAVDIALQGEYTVSLQGLDGRRLAVRRGLGPGRFLFASGKASRTALLGVVKGSDSFARLVTF